MPFDIGQYTLAEANQLYVEHNKAKWDHTAKLSATIQTVFGKKKVDPKTQNPWEKQ